MAGTVSALTPIQQAQAHLAANEASQALDLVRPIAAAEPANATAQRLHAFALLALGRFDEAREPAEKAAVLAPMDADARYARGFVWAHAGRNAEAVEELDAALALNPMHTGAKPLLVHTLQALALAQRDDPRAAEAALDRAHKLDKHNPQPILGLFQLYLANGMRQKAAGLYESLDKDLLSQPGIEAIVEQMKQDPDIAPLLKLHTPTAAAPRRPTYDLSAIPLGSPGNPVFDRQKVKDMRDPWQTTAFTVMSFLFIGYAILEIMLGLVGSVGGGVFAMQYFIVLGCVHLAMAIGFLTRNEIALFIGKILLWLNTAVIAFGLLASLLMGDWAGAAVNLVTGSIVGFLLYLVTFESD